MRESCFFFYRQKISDGTTLFGSRSPALPFRGQDNVDNLMEISVLGVSPSVKTRLQASGFQSVEELMNATVKDLMKGFENASLLSSLSGLLLLSTFFRFGVLYLLERIF